MFFFLDNTPPTRSRLQFIPPPEEEGEFLLWYVKKIEIFHHLDKKGIDEFEKNRYSLTYIIYNILSKG